LSFAAEKEGVTGVFNAGYGGQMTINDLAGRVISAAGSFSRVLHAPERAGDVKHSRASADKLLAAGWRPDHDLKEGLATTLGFFRAREAGGDPA
jgi:UDP-glucose 4-epimerase